MHEQILTRVIVTQTGGIYYHNHNKAKDNTYTCGHAKVTPPLQTLV